MARPRSLAPALAAALALACSPPSVDVRAPAEPPAAVVIQDVAVLDVASGALRSARDVTLRGDRIAAIAPTGRAAPPADALVLSGAGATLVPGLIDMHGHVESGTRPVWEGGLPDPDGNLRAYLYSGVTTLLDPGASFDAFERRDRVASGELVGPRIFSAGPVVTCEDGHPVAMVRIFAPWWIRWLVEGQIAAVVSSPEDARSVVAAQASAGADVVKIAIDAIPLEAPLLSRELARAVVEQARRHDLRVVAHIGTFDDAVAAAEAGVAAWVHGVYKEALTDAQARQLAGYGIPMVATLEVFDRYARALEPRASTPLERETVPADVLDSFHPIPEDFSLGAFEAWVELANEQREVGLANLRRLRRAGVTILAGSDTQSGVFPGAGLHRELHQLVRGGMTPAEAIRAATLDAARFLEERDDPDFGSVATGKRADLLLVEGDPTRDVAALARIRHVIQGGVPLERTAIARP